MYHGRVEDLCNVTNSSWVIRGSLFEVDEIRLIVIICRLNNSTWITNNSYFGIFGRDTKVRYFKKLGSFETTTLFKTKSYIYISLFYHQSWDISKDKILDLIYLVHAWCYEYR